MTPRSVRKSTTDGLNFFRDETFMSPVGLQITEFEELRNLIERDFDAIFGQVKACGSTIVFITIYYLYICNYLHSINLQSTHGTRIKLFFLALRILQAIPPR